MIEVEVLSRGLNNLASQPCFQGFGVPQGYPGVTHLAFPDDVLILANGSTASLHRVMRVLDAYQRSLVNYSMLKRVATWFTRPYPVQDVG